MYPSVFICILCSSFPASFIWSSCISSGVFPYCFAICSSAWYSDCLTGVSSSVGYSFGVCGAVFLAPRLYPSLAASLFVHSVGSCERVF